MSVLVPTSSLLCSGCFQVLRVGRHPYFPGATLVSPCQMPLCRYFAERDPGQTWSGDVAAAGPALASRPNAAGPPVSEPAASYPLAPLLAAGAAAGWGAAEDGASGMDLDSGLDRESPVPGGLFGEPQHGECQVDASTPASASSFRPSSGPTNVSVRTPSPISALRATPPPKKALRGSVCPQRQPSLRVKALGNAYLLHQGEKTRELSAIDPACLAARGAGFVPVPTRRSPRCGGLGPAR